MTRTQKRLIARLIELGWTGGTAQYRTDYDAMEFSEGLFGDCAYWEIMAWFGVERTTRAYKYWRFNNSTDALAGLSGPA